METLAEDLLLLALDDDKGTISWERSDVLPYGLGGALLMDLAARRRIASVDDKITIRDPTPLGDDVLDTALETIRESSKQRDAKHWVNKLGGRKGLKEQLARRLVARGILREQEHAFLWVFHDQRFPTTDLSLETAIRVRIRDVVLADAEPDTRTVMLISLVNACRLTDRLFSKDERKRAERRIEELIESDQFGEVVDEAIMDLITAVAVAVWTAAVSTVVAPGSSN
jgi:hypothetical protein